jgi:hypothetical protein
MSILSIIKNYISNFFLSIEEKYGGLNRELSEEEAQKIRDSIPNTYPKKPFKCTSKKFKVPEKRKVIKQSSKIKPKQSAVIKYRNLNLELYPIYESPKPRIVKQQDSCQLKYG